MKKLLFSIVLASLVFASNSMAANAWEPSFYLGAGYGFSDFDTGVGSLTGTASLDDDDSGFKILGGVKFNKFLGLELSYNDFGEAELRGNNGDTFVFNGITRTFLADGVTLEAEADTIAIEAVVFAPLDELTGNDSLKYFEPFLKVGAHFWDIEYSIAASNISSTFADDDGTDVVFGAGINFNFDFLTIRAEWQRFNTDDEIDFFSGSLIFNF